jgi:hypothetical protein
VHQIKRELRDLLSLWLVPGLAALLPWRWCVAIYWQLARWPRLMGEEVGGSRGGRATMGLDPDDAEFDRRFRFGFLLEHADAFRALARGWRGLAATMPVQLRDHEHAGPGLCYFFNFNQGLPALASLRAAGFDVYLVYRSLQQRPEGVGWLRYGYMRLRLRMVAKVCGNTGIGTGGARERIAATMATGGLVCVAADTPPRAGTGLVAVDLPGGRRGWWRSGILKLGLELGGPLRCFTVDLDWSTRERRLLVRTLEASDDLAALTRQLSARFVEQWQREPALWFYWPVPQAFLICPPDARIDVAPPGDDAPARL